MSHRPCLGKGGSFARPLSLVAHEGLDLLLGPYQARRVPGAAHHGAGTRETGTCGQPERGARAREAGVRCRSLRCWQPWYDSRLVTGSVLCLLVVQVVRALVVAGLACHHVIVLTPGRSTDPHFPPPHGVRWLQMACALVRVQESALWHKTCIKHHVRRVVFILGTLRLPRGAAPSSTAARTEGAPVPS